MTPAAKEKLKAKRIARKQRLAERKARRKAKRESKAAPKRALRAWATEVCRGGVCAVCRIGKVNKMDAMGNPKMSKKRTEVKNSRQSTSWLLGRLNLALKN